MTTLALQFEQYGAWRTGVLHSLAEFRSWLQQHDLYDAQADERAQRIQAVLKSDRLKVAFIAEFSRGKSELINAIFFADYGRRILPSSAGRTTMCPTELRYDEAEAPSIRLLPIETRLQEASTADFLDVDSHWHTVPLDPSSPDGMLDAFRHVIETSRVTRTMAESLGLYNENDPDAAYALDADGMVEISRWRHAVINFPHPLLRQGLVILDTPGLNAIGTEPELTLRLIPDAHVVVFMLAADAGVTKSDLALWRSHVSAGHRKGCLAVLNKIDGLWDPLKSPAETAAEITHQVTTSAQVLGIDESRVYPVSAQKGLVAKVTHDDDLLVRSGLPQFEHVLSDQLIPQRREIVADQVQRSVAEMARGAQQLLQSRRRSIVEQLFELRGLRGKNHAMVKHMLMRVQSEKEEFEQSIAKFQALRLVFGRHSADIIKSLQLRDVRQAMRERREQMKERFFSRGMREDMDELFARLGQLVSEADQKIVQLHQLTDSMYRRFNAEHGFTLPAPIQFVTARYLSELQQTLALAHAHFGTMNILTRSRPQLVQSAFSTIASRVLETFRDLNRDIEIWLKSVMTPLEAQVREHQKQLRRRVDSIERIHEATDTLESRIAQLEEVLNGLDERSGRIESFSRQVMQPHGDAGQLKAVAA
ncbi:dynamin-like GTPase family protein [Cupriavidus basilensis]|uniref:Dynamin-like GTPase family protein n=1 Tax=Cupriavidus basilensis TaxID=68895 RepID=A0ABT6AH27_9BURK|nr:dynamin-like GTPase family protein [Cupriavidus basilensis]MDF3831906.1 dynamin-like GTPase family protein [Cupriavidus basilensis]